MALNTKSTLVKTVILFACISTAKPLVESSGRRLGDLGSRGSSGEPHHFHIIELSLEDCRGRGLGQIWRELHLVNASVYPSQLAMSIEAKLSDGSDLIGDGVGLIAAMRRKRSFVTD